MGWQRLIDTVTRLVPDADLALRPPLPPENVERLLASLPEAAHEPLRRIYAVGNGQGADADFGVISGCTWRSLGDVVSFWTMACTLEDEIKNREPDVPCVPENAMRHVWQADGWISIAHDWGNLEIGIDTTPGPAGSVGQVVNWGSEYEDHYVLAHDLDAMANTIADCLEAGQYYMEREDGLAPFPRLRTAPAGVSALRFLLGSEPTDDEEHPEHPVPLLSTAHLAGLPDIDGFRRLTKSLAVLDAIFSADWMYRWFSFDARWSPDDGTMLASMRNGSGDEWFAVLTPEGVALRGLAHESPTFEAGTPKPWVFRDLPSVFHEALLNEAAADASNSSYCIWRLASDDAWRSGVPLGEPVEDGSHEHLAILAGDPVTYMVHAEHQEERPISLEAVRSVYAHEPITLSLAQELNPHVDWETLQQDLESIGYPEPQQGT